ncbi:MAG: hypothetical protein WD712_00350 [Candidatus Spechtbacterales bacterium]
MKVIFKIVFVSVVLLLAAGSGVRASGTSFFVDQGFDQFSRTNITATLRIDGQNAQFYVEDRHWDLLSGADRASALSALDDLSSSFDNQIYPSLTAVLGSEWNPGIDGNPKITILLTDLKNGFGGYFRDDDEYLKTAVSSSNEREMFYINTDFIGFSRHLKAFAAHEFQHLINFNQKDRLRNVKEKLWLNELASEVAPTLAGLNKPYSGSNLQSRVNVFLDNASDALTRWSGNSEDYGIVSVFGHYLLDHYGSGFFTSVEQSPQTGFKAINGVIEATGKSETFSEVFRDWVVAVLLNDCDVLPQNTFCYFDPDLGFNNLHIKFSGGTESGNSFTKFASTYPWQPEWYSYERDIQPKPADHIFTFTFINNSNSEFTVPYVVYPTNGLPQVYYMGIVNGKGKFYVENFGYEVSKVVVMPVNMGVDDNFLSSFTMTAETGTTIPTDTTESTAAASFTPLPEGSLVRAYADEKVYIIKNPSTGSGQAYKRWVQRPEIIDMYGHLRWEDVIVVPKEQLDAYQEAGVVRLFGDPRVYGVNSAGQKRWIQTEAEFLSLGYKFDMVYIINDSEFNFYPTI